MSRVFESYPLPWRVSTAMKPVSKNSWDGYNRTTTNETVNVILDANGKEVPLASQNALVDLVEITSQLSRGAKKRLGQQSRSTQLFAIKDGHTGKFYGSDTTLVQYAKLWRTKERAQKMANRLNMNQGGRHTVFEVKMSVV